MYFLQRLTNLAPKALQDFLSAEAFMDLLQISNTKDEGSVAVDSIIDYLVTKKDKLSKLIHLHYYDSASKGYLSTEVIIFFQYLVKMNCCCRCNTPDCIYLKNFSQVIFAGFTRFFRRRSATSYTLSCQFECKLYYC